MAPAKKAARKAPAKKAAKKTAKKATVRKATKRAAKKATKKTTRSRAGKRTSAAASVLVATKVREAVKGHDARMASDFVDALNGEINSLIAKAAARAKDNNRQTVRPGDL